MTCPRCHLVRRPRVRILGVATSPQNHQAGHVRTPVHHQSVNLVQGHEANTADPRPAPRADLDHGVVLVPEVTAADLDLITVDRGHGLVPGRSIPAVVRGLEVTRATEGACTTEEVASAAGTTIVAPTTNRGSKTIKTIVVIIAVEVAIIGMGVTSAITGIIEGVAGISITTIVDVDHVADSVAVTLEISGIAGMIEAGAGIFLGTGRLVGRMMTP